MDASLTAALLSNFILCACQLYCLGRLRRKADILRYYTFLQNFLTAAVSALFCVRLALALSGGKALPEYISGLRYVSLCGLTAAALIYLVFLSPKGNNAMKAEDFKGLSPGCANFLLHIFCPGLSLLSFVFFERQLPLSLPLWTALAALPSALYWLAYLILSAAKLWEEPYDFSPSASENTKCFPQVLSFILIPVLFVLISIILWEIR